MTYPTITAAASVIASRSLSSAADWTHTLESVFRTSAAVGGQFDVQLAIPNLDKPLPAFAVVTRLGSGFDLVFTRDPDYLANTAR